MVKIYVFGGNSALNERYFTNEFFYTEPMLQPSLLPSYMHVSVKRVPE
jgi:hypothetical protein